MERYKLDLKKEELKEGKPTGVVLNGHRIALIMEGGQLYAINAVCTHKGGPLEEGQIDADKHTIICPWHGGRFDVRNGNADKATPWVTDTTVYKTEIDASSGEIFIYM